MTACREGAGQKEAEGLPMCAPDPGPREPGAVLDAKGTVVNKAEGSLPS